MSGTTFRRYHFSGIFGQVTAMAMVVPLAPNGPTTRLDREFSTANKVKVQICLHGHVPTFPRSGPVNLNGVEHIMLLCRAIAGPLNCLLSIGVEKDGVWPCTPGRFGDRAAWALAGGGGRLAGLPSTAACIGEVDDNDSCYSRGGASAIVVL